MPISYEQKDEFPPGTVWLAGAGPGDPGLLTLRTAHAMQQADIIVHDALVSAEILALAGKGVRVHYAGKRGGKPSPKQRDISLLLVEHARAGRRVLRLKGGDPFLFGRGAEEALTLVEHGIPFRIVPGISAGLGGLADAGIPLTHRDLNQTVTFLTGHDATGDLPGSIHWSGVVKGGGVLVFYMAMKHWTNISAQLLKAGMSPEMPVAFVSDATTGKQNVVETVLADSVEAIQRFQIEPPAIVVVGEVVRLRSGMDWLGALTGKILTADPLGTRSKREAG